MVSWSGVFSVAQLSEHSRQKQKAASNAAVAKILTLALSLKEEADYSSLSSVLICPLVFIPTF